MKETVVTACIPPTTAMDPRLIAAAWFADCHHAPLLRHPGATPVDLFLAVFGHHPLWIKWVLIARNLAARAVGLKTASIAQILRPPVKADYRVGDTIGPWPIFSLSESEIIAGRDEKHLDFRLSVLKLAGEGGPSVAVTTVCKTHNAFGKVYLWFVVPFHKWGMRQLMANAVRNGRL